MAGLEVLFSSVQSKLKGAEDAIICCLHWTIIKHDLKCIGTGEKIPDDVDSLKKSELLPSGWNDAQDVYTLWYIQPKNKLVYMLKVIKVDEELLVHFMKMKDETVADMMMNISEYSTGDNSSFESAYRNIEKLQTRFTQDCLEPVLQLSKAKTQVTDGKKQQHSTDSDEQSGKQPAREIHPERMEVPHPPRWQEPDDPFAIGHGDLDPLGHPGGGMVFDPLRVNRPVRGMNPSAGLPHPLPPGAVPPGARFDPFGPDVGGGGVPRPYDRRLPGDDYMFM